MAIYRIHSFQFFNKIRIIRQCLEYFPCILVLFVLHSHICTFAYIMKKTYKKTRSSGICLQPKTLSFIIQNSIVFNVSTQDLQRRSVSLRYTLHRAFQTLPCHHIRTRRHTRQCRKYGLRLCRTYGRPP